MARQEMDDFGGGQPWSFGDSASSPPKNVLVKAGSAQGGKTWYKVYVDDPFNPKVYTWEAMDESGILKKGTAPTQVEAENAAVVGMYALAVSKGLIPASVIVPKPVPGAPTVVVQPAAAPDWLAQLQTGINGFVAEVKKAFGIK